MKREGLIGGVLQILCASSLAACSNARPATQEESWDTNLVVASQPLGDAWTKCGQNKKRVRLGDVFDTVDDLMMASCSYSDGRRELNIIYLGPIDAYFDRLVAAAAKLAEMQRDNNPLWIRLNISSPGGDVRAAIVAAQRMSSAKWEVSIPDQSECNSACVIVYAAGTRRLSGKESRLGVHRIFPSQSSARSASDLDAELEPTISDARKILRENGVSSGLLDLMATVPSREIHYLSYDEIDRFGLGYENAARADLRRLHNERKCGTKFQNEVMSAPTWFQTCLNGGLETSRDEMVRCVVNEAEKRGLLDAACRQEFCDEFNGLCEPLGPVKRDPFFESITKDRTSPQSGEKVSRQ